MKASIIIAHDDERDPQLLNRARASINHEICRLNMLADFEVIVESDGSKSESRNVGAARAQGEILIFLDDDVKIKSGFLSEILEPFDYPPVGVVGGVNVAFPEISFQEEISAVLWSSPFIMARSSARYTPRGRIRETDESEIIGCCMAIRKEAFQEAGGFPLDVIPCEENLLINNIQDLGWKVLYSPYAIVYHERPAFPGEYMRKVFGYGFGRGQLLRKKAARGSPKMLWKPNQKWVLYAMGFIIHYCSYLAGLLYGYFAEKEDQEETKK